MERKRVLVLGAGVSAYATGGMLPSCLDLFEHLETDSKKHPSSKRAKHWRSWKDFQGSLNDTPLAPFLNHHNPEFVLSTLDMFSGAQDSHMGEWWNILCTLSEAANPEDETRIGEELKRHRQRGMHPTEVTVGAEAAREHLLRAIEDLFWDRGRDLDNEKHSIHASKSFLWFRNLLSRLREGDTVITFNWDWLAERILGGEGLWNPTTGYGFDWPLAKVRRQTFKEYLGESKRPLPDSADFFKEPTVVLDPAPVKILKLHGSMGWIRENSPFKTHNGSIAEDRRGLFQLLPVLNRSNDYTYCYEQPESAKVQLGQTVLAPPTFLKTFPESSEIQQIWSKATIALDEAHSVMFRGYSFPESDVASRVLFNNLAIRYRREEVDLNGVDLSPATRRRWNDFFGGTVFPDAPDRFDQDDTLDHLGD